MAKQRIPRSVMAQPLQECSLLDWAADTITESIGVRWFFSGGSDDGPDIDVPRLVRDLWGEAYRKSPRHVGTVDPSEFARFYVREVMSWCSEHITTGGCGDWIGVRGLGEHR